ncbi:MAG: PEP-CTERM sorting domain-containing protein [Opitutales bacterium]|nr:PEP-CTERM sorting domain-containing protein [Opitutales bacterium]
MKKIAFYLPLVMATSLFASPAYIKTATDTITGSSDAENPALFTDATAWGGEEPELKNTSYVKLTGASDGTLYYDINGSPTLRAIFTDESITSNYVIDNTATDSVTTFDINASDATERTVIQYSLGSLEGSLRIRGNYDIISSGSATGTNAVASIVMASTKTSSFSKGIYFEKGSTINSYVTLSFWGSVNDYGNGINIAGTVNAYNDSQDQWGKIELDWSTNPYDTKGGGVRTKLVINDGGVVNTGTFHMGTRSILKVENNGTLNVYDNLEFRRNQLNPLSLNVDAGGNVSIAKDLVFVGDAATNSSGTSSFQIDGNMTVGGDIKASTGKEACLNYHKTTVNGSLSVGGTYYMAPSGHSLVLNNGSKFTGAINQNGGTITFAKTSTWDAQRTSTFTTAVQLGGNINIAKDALIEYTNTQGVIGANANTITIDGELKVSASFTSNTYYLKIDAGKTIVNKDGKINLAATTTSTYAYGLELNGTLDLYGTLTTPKVLLKNGTLIVRESADLGTDKFEITTPQGTYKPRLELYKNINVSDFYIQKDTSITIALGNDNAGITASQIRGQNNENVNIIFEDFQNNKIFVVSRSNLDYITFSGEALDGTELADENFFWQSTTGGFWLNYAFATVPEPAEWAMILGSLALGFAIYRRRK